MYAKIMGETISRESIRSNIPPCPGNRVPLSLMPAVRLISDSIKSPHVANAAVIRPNPIKLVRVKVSKYCGHKIYMAIAADRQAANPPTRPPMISLARFVGTFYAVLARSLPKMHRCR